MFQNIDENIIYQYAEQLKLHDLFKNMPEGYKTIIGQGERQLSGGEARRLMLLRVFVQPKLLVIFDEPTAMLDIESELIINEAINKLKDISTVFIIAHNKHTIESASHVVLVKNGRVSLHHKVKVSEVI